MASRISWFGKAVSLVGTPALGYREKQEILSRIREDRMGRQARMRQHIDMEVECDKAAVLDKVRSNRAGHAKIVEEARVGFVDKAAALLTAELEKVKAGKISELFVRLEAPADHTREYDTVIKMLEMHTEETITLGAAEVQMFIEDNWEWSDQFIAVNAAYSGTAALRRGS